MKGPGERHKYDLRRVWECPVCHHHEKTSGAVTSALCHCQAKVSGPERQFMKLVSDGPRRTTPRQNPQSPELTPFSSESATPGESDIPRP